MCDTPVIRTITYKKLLSKLDFLIIIRLLIDQSVSKFEKVNFMIKEFHAETVKTVADEHEGITKHDRILDAAEIVFAGSGYEGASMRQIAAQADVAQSLIHYHFKNKESLFEALFARRSSQINSTREETLATLFEGETLPELEQVVDALLRPTISFGLNMSGDSSAFSRILAAFAASADDRDQELSKKYYDPIAHKFIAAFQKIRPALTEQDAVWAYMFSIGVGITMMAKTGRPARLSNGLCDEHDIGHVMLRMTPFVCAGIRALNLPD